MTTRERTIDLNGDVGEGIGRDRELIPFLSSANIACGFHAGDPRTMRETVELCMEHGVAIGAHPGLPDRAGFGRRAMAISPREAADDLLYQLGSLYAFVRAAGGRIRHVKLHGALYHMADRSEELADAIVGAVRRFDPSLGLFVPPGGLLARSAEAAGLGYAVEAFADRRYGADGRLLPRGADGAVLERPEEAAEQALAIAACGVVRTADGGTAEVRAGTICIHGDSPRAPEIAAAVRRALEREGWRIVSPFAPN
ncbi:MAG: lactam utilization protein LamB [Thermobacillus sp. ZCTH02-B1]|uniref:LamB/YcsF family protein n=1 Tax=Thermobacillus sp. ZCTH02-B1 TaxID=1858795 RepID=UPI000B578603|nr:5-oxoprolinase subunit PxpA [Thermobacillus sp. ZCTH02-B1]OUM95364.1 MAG: lactam utilization protein LamB [Thermobacillus sp. ZCTH02-B1]